MLKPYVEYLRSMQNNYQLIKEHTLVLALIGYYDMSNKLPLEHMAFGNHHLWSYYLELHQELYNRLIESKDESISNYGKSDYIGDVVMM